ncbi:hypothetical protein S245_053826 [Arachis hypogaea]
MLADPKEARARIREVHFFPFNPGDKRTALTYIESDGNWHISSKGAPEQILNLCNYKEDVRRKAMQLLLSLLSVGSDLWGLLDRKYLRNQKMLLVHYGNFLRCYHYLILPGMIALKPSQEP